jgi:hypothetical protein
MFTATVAKRQKLWLWAVPSLITVVALAVAGAVTMSSSEGTVIVWIAGAAAVTYGWRTYLVIPRSVGVNGTNLDLHRRTGLTTVAIHEIQRVDLRPGLFIILKVGKRTISLWRRMQHLQSVVAEIKHQNPGVVVVGELASVGAEGIKGAGPPWAYAVLGSFLATASAVLFFAGPLGVPDRSSLTIVSGEIDSVSVTDHVRIGRRLHLVLRERNRRHHLVQADVSAEFPTVLRLRGELVRALTHPYSFGAKPQESVWQIERGDDVIFTYDDTVRIRAEHAKRFRPIAFVGAAVSLIWLGYGAMLRIKTGAWRSVRPN